MTKIGPDGEILMACSNCGGGPLVREGAPGGQRLVCPDCGHDLVADWEAAE